MKQSQWERDCFAFGIGEDPYSLDQVHAKAEQFAAQQATPEKGKRVYFNTLAVYAVYSYLKWLQIETNLRQSDSWHPAKRAVFDVADLAIPGIGKLECRPVLPGQTAFYLPLEVTENRIGYVGVQFGDRLEEVQLLGFARTVDAVNPPEQLQVANLQPLDALIDHIYRLKAAAETRVNLSQWFENTFEAGWQRVEALLGREQAYLALSFRNPTEACIERGKLIDLGMQLAGYPIALVVAIAPVAQQDVDITLQVHPTGDLRYLPPRLQMSVLDEAGTPVLEAQARSADNYIQLQFSGELGEGFTVKVALGDVSVTENFVI